MKANLLMDPPPSTVCFAILPLYLDKLDCQGATDLYKRKVALELFGKFALIPLLRILLLKEIFNYFNRPSRKGKWRERSCVVRS